MSLLTYTQSEVSETVPIKTTWSSQVKPNILWLWLLAGKAAAAGSTSSSTASPLFLTFMVRVLSLPSDTLLTVTASSQLSLFV